MKKPFTPSTKTVNGRTFLRIPIKTHKVMFGEDLAGVIEKYAAASLRPDTIMCLSEKFVTICLNNVRHISTVKVGWLTRLIVRYVTKYEKDLGFSRPEKMQVAVETAGYPRIIAAIIFGGISKYIFRRRGDFYRIAGHRISEIDGFNPLAMEPFTQYAMLPPPEPHKICDDLAKRFNCAVFICDGNNIDVAIVSMSKNMADRDVNKAMAYDIMRDNPMGQDDELTPIFILTEQTKV